MLLLPALFVAVCTFGLANGYSCKSLAGKDVDWFVAYKMPRMGTQSDGAEFLYADASSASKWTQSKLGIDDEQSAIGLTVGQLFAAKQSTETDFYAAYNDQQPDGKTSSRAHMKGVLAFGGGGTGFWLIHSVPKFPDADADRYAYPDNGLDNGQSLMCVTFPRAALDQIGKQLYTAQPNTYSFNLPSDFESDFPDLAKAVTKARFASSSPNASIAEMSSNGKQRLSISQLNAHFDLYADLVVPALKSSVYVESWMNGATASNPNLPSDCSTDFKVYNVRGVGVNANSAFEFSTSKDHSKWAVSTADARSQWLCIGDINRQSSQAKRGGGTMCLPNAKVAALFRATINEVQCCESTAAETCDAQAGCCEEESAK